MANKMLTNPTVNFLYGNCDVASGIKRILGECLLISSLPGKALRTLVDIARLAERFNMRSQSGAW